MELTNYNITDDQALSLISDFVQSQEKLQAQIDHAKAIGGENPRFSHYTSAASTLENFRQLMVA